MNLTQQVNEGLPRWQHMAWPPKWQDFGIIGRNATTCCAAISKLRVRRSGPAALQIAHMTLTKPTFPAPDHDHDRCTADAIDHAERVCKLRAQKFTPIRRQVLQALLSSHRPLGAYEVIDELAKSMPRPAPITVYRALDFLMENGLVHRIESRNAYLACAHDHDTAAMVAFLICERCGSVGEIPAAPVAQSLNAAARATGFAPKLSVVEITGTCRHCQK
jgi:Fur family transcriptional regulator, zinc uptake regulator